MTTAQAIHPGSANAPDVGQMLAALAEHARRRQYEQGPTGAREPLLSWERVAEFDAFRITVRCDYTMTGAERNGE